MKLSVVVPVHNEAGNIRPLLTELVNALNGKYEYEIIYIDDGSTDETFCELKRFMKSCPQLRLIRHAACYGQSTAILTGVKASSASIIAMIDGDMQNDPEDILPMVDTYLRNYENRDVLVTGFREKRQDSILKKISSKIANNVRSALLQDNTQDTGCGLKVFGKDFFLSLPYFDHMHRFIPALSKRGGAQIISVNVNHRPRQLGISKYGTLDRLKAGIVDLAGVFWLMKRYKKPEISVNLQGSLFTCAIFSLSSGIGEKKKSCNMNSL